MRRILIIRDWERRPSFRVVASSSPGSARAAALRAEPFFMGEVILFFFGLLSLKLILTYFSKNYDDLFNEVANGLKDGICIVKNLKITYYNPGFLRVFDLQAEEVPQITLSQLVSDSCHATLFSSLASTSNSVSTFEVTALKKAGQSFPAEVYIRSLGTSQPRHLFIWRDISLSKQGNGPQQYMFGT